MQRYPEITGNAIQFINSKDSNVIEKFLTETASNSFLGDSAVDFENFISTALLIIKLIPDNVLQALLRFRTHGNKDGVLLIKGLHIKDLTLGPTPNDIIDQPTAKQSYETELYLVGFSSILGEIFAFNSQYGGQIIQNIVPIREHANEQSGLGSAVFLDWHTEDAAFDYRADIVALLCLRSDPVATTTICSIRNVHLLDHYKKKLFQPLYQIELDKVHQIKSLKGRQTIPILFGPSDDPFIRLDPIYMRGINPEAQEALDYIIQEIPNAARQITLEIGDLLFIDNYRVVHGRTQFTPRYDGTDRWLRRTNITFDLRKTNHLRLDHFRKIKPK